jgi:hypothetical protein
VLAVAVFHLEILRFSWLKLDGTPAWLLWGAVHVSFLMVEDWKLKSNVLHAKFLRALALQ